MYYALGNKTMKYSFMYCTNCRTMNRKSFHEATTHELTPRVFHRRLNWTNFDRDATAVSIFDTQNSL